MITILLFRILLPIVITICVIFRPSGLSSIYLFILFYLPFVPLPTARTMAGHSGIFLKILIVISVLTSLCQIAFQLLLVFLPQFLETASNLEKIMRHAGFVRLNHISPAAAVRWISPEVLMLISSVSFFIVIRKINSPDQLAVSSDDELLGRSKTQRYVSTLVAVGRFSVLALLCVAGVLRPSVLGGLYYLIFLSAATWWACYKQLTRGFAIVLSCLMPVVFIHIGALYSYQFEWPQEFLESNSTYARYFGLTQLILTPSNTTDSSSNVTDPREFSYNKNEEWVSFINPIFLYLLYYISIFEAKQLFDPELKKKQGTFSRLEGSFRGKLGRTMSQRLANKRLVRSSTPKTRWQSATRKVRDTIVYQNQQPEPGETTPLIRGVSPSKRTGSDRRSGVHESVASGTATGNTEDIPLDELEDASLKDLTFTDENYEPTLFDNVLYALESILELIVRNSYIGTNIIMMAWSITYLSWITFVLLIWANLIWLIPNQRKSMLRSSPLLVFYAWFLLLMSYVYSMNLTDDELPSTIDGYNLEEIGFQKMKTYPCENLFVKSLYTIMFWVTLRQFMQERSEKRQSSALADMVAPLQVTVGTATGVNREQEKTGSRVMEVIGTYIKKFLTRFWIWIVAITLFAVAITGERMTGFRILYMALFLFFLITFQLSFNLWRKIMFGFWLTVIIYSMIILVLVYTYQFKNFPSYWTNYLHIPEKIQLDIGLEQFATKQLFVRLFIPTFFVIITVIQLHYFHDDFMIISDPKNTNANIRPTEDVEDLEQSSMQGGAELEHSIKEETSSSVQFDIYALGYMSSDKFQTIAKRGLNKLHRMVNLIFLFLEIHMLKIVLFLAMMVCIYDKCAIYMIVVIMLCLGLTCGRPMQMLAVYSTSILVSVLMLARMIYQIQYITPMEWNVTCQLKEDSQHNQTITNNAPWLGFQKTEEANRSLAGLVKWNIIYIIIATLWSVILVRQFNYRATRGRPTTRAFFMFPNITRNHADKDLEHCLKYLFNYGFYKFGVEICLMIAVILIGVRMDLYALLHATWLVILFLMPRRMKARIWVFYLVFTAITIPFQYFMTVGLPPSLCQEFPWDDEGDKRWANFRDWAYLLDFYYPPPERKLICDFILLLAISRQWVVFRIEKRYAGKNYAGGSNEMIIHLAEDKNFKNPVPDFITYVRSYLDIFKKCLLQSFLWITLALVFLAGTNRVNIFSVGYLLGAFVFLWHGSDLYLRPIPKILKRWHLLIGYNVVVIFLKASFQIVGCVFSQDLPEKLQGLVQMIGIGCVRKFSCPDPLLHVEKTEYTGIAWDAVCFGFLIIQSRIFKSFNFFHIIDDTKATTILASRGAELMEQMEQKTAKEQEEEERQILEKIKLKMDRIKASQQKIQGAHYNETANHYEDRAPLARSSSTTSCTSATSQDSTPAGYHTPIDEEDHPPLTPRSSSLINPQAPPSPYSAVMTTSLDGYLEPQRMSFSSPPNSELNPRPSSPDDSFPVFSPPPYNEAVPDTEPITELPTAIERRKNSIGPPWMQGSCITPRQSIISYSSRSQLSHHESIRSGDYYMFDELEDDELDLVIQAKPHDDEDEFERPNIGQLLSTAMKTDIDTALRNQSQLGLVRQYSMPLSRQKSARSQLSAAFSAPPTIEEHEPRSVRIQEAPEREDQPGTSTGKDEDFSEFEEYPKESVGRKILKVLLFIWAFLESSMVSLTNFLNKYSRNYRYIVRVLRKEKKLLKERTNYSLGVRIGPSQVWHPSGSYANILQQSIDGSQILSSSSVGMFSPSDSYRNTLENKRKSSTQISDSEGKRSDDSDTKMLTGSLPYSTEQDRKSTESQIAPHDIDYSEEMSSRDQPTVFRLVLAIWYIIMSRSEFMCFFVIFLNQIKTATFLSLPLPLMVFFWGALTIPRPTKTFWVTIIAYTEVIVLLKCMFQFDIMPGNIARNKPEFIWSNTEMNVMYPSNLWGLYRQENYATWDLLLLLVVFFHRVLMKSMGIWSSSEPVPAALLADGEYKIENGDLVPLTSSSPKSEGRKSKSPTPSDKRKSPTPSLKRKSPTPSDKGSPSTSRGVGSHASSQKSSVSEDEKIILIKTRPIIPIDKLATAARMTMTRYAEAFRIFNHELLDPSSRVAVDVYFLMFFCDFFNFFVILFGYSSFGSQHDGGVKDYLEDNRVPPLFLFMLIFQFMLIIIDRGIYLQKNILAKVIFQYVQIVLLHAWMFALFPIITGGPCNRVIPPQIYYMVKCFYLLLSAYQIRCGYPTRILGNFLCKGYGYVNMILFKAFMLVPFLFELRTCMDWMWTETSMTIFDWIKMEDIFQHIFLLKCNRYVEDEYPQPRGEKKKPLIKYLMGGGVLAVIIAIIWFPLVFFSLGNAVGQTNIPSDVTLEIRIGPYDPVYKMTAQSNSIFSFTEEELEAFHSLYNGHKVSETFIYNYEAADIAAVKLSTDSANVWSVSPPDRNRMLAEVNSTKPLTVTLKYQVVHKTSKAEDSGIVQGTKAIELQHGTKDTPDGKARREIHRMLLGEPSEPVLFRYLFPKFLKVTNRGTVTPVEDLMVENPVKEASIYRNITLELQQADANNSKEWWVVHEECHDYNYVTFLQYAPFVDCDNSLILYTFNDKVFPPTLDIITGGGIIGLYTTLVFVASRVLRGFFADQCSKIMFDDMPYVDRVLQLCLDIYLVREASEFTLEEDLFAKLVFLFRSPETLIKWTRPKEELVDNDDPEGDAE